MLEITNLTVKAEDKTILSDINLKLEGGKVYALMGPNGSGKSTLAQVVAGNPNFCVLNGSVTYNEENVLALTPDKRSSLGIFLSFQHPLEIAGLNVMSYLRLIYSRKRSENVLPHKFKPLLEERMSLLNMKPEFLQRYLNDGFSGGEKKRMEILQMLLLEPSLIILDEVDSGLDIDALKDVMNAIKWLREKNPDMTILFITHYTKILSVVTPDFVYIMKDGKISSSGDKSLIQDIETHGYAR